MDTGLVFAMVAVVIFFLAGIDVPIPKVTDWGLFALALSVLLRDVPLPLKKDDEKKRLN